MSTLLKAILIVIVVIMSITALFKLLAPKTKPLDTSINEPKETPNDENKDDKDDGGGGNLAPIQYRLYEKNFGYPYNAYIVSNNQQAYIIITDKVQKFTGPATINLNAPTTGEYTHIATFEKVVFKQNNEIAFNHELKNFLFQVSSNPTLTVSETTANSTVTSSTNSDDIFNFHTGLITGKDRSIVVQNGSNSYVAISDNLHSVGSSGAFTTALDQFNYPYFFIAPFLETLEEENNIISFNHSGKSFSLNTSSNTLSINNAPQN